MKVKSNQTKMKRITKIVIIGLGLPAMVYLTTCTYLWARQSYLIFTPKRALSQTPSDYALDYRDVYFPAPQDLKNEMIHAWWIPAGLKPRGTLLYLHGSALNIGANVAHAKRFHDLGLSVLLLSYRGYGQSEGDFPSEDQIYADAAAAWNYLVDTMRIAPENVLVYGHSLGGAVAIDLATKVSGMAGLIVEATFTSIGDMALLEPKYRIFPIRLLLDQHFDSLSKVSNLKAPILFLHGTADRFVPHWMARELYDQTRASKRLVLILGGGHNNSARVGGRHYLDSVEQFVARHLTE
jgi:fermentation-respiration switch protein FrsA (DUF1100 family)